MTTVQIVPKAQLTDTQLTSIGERLLAPEHAFDCGPATCWGKYANGLYAAVDTGSGNVVGLIEASGPADAVVPGWWIDSMYRGKGYGMALVDALTIHLKKLGYTGVGHITIQTHGGEHDVASSKLSKRFRSQFQRFGG